MFYGVVLDQTKNPFLFFLAFLGGSLFDSSPLLSAASPLAFLFFSPFLSAFSPFLSAFSPCLSAFSVFLSAFSSFAVVASLTAAAFLAFPFFPKTN